MLYQIIKIIGISFFGTLKAFFVSFIELLPTISLFKDIANAFSYPAIICGLIGIPISFAFIVKFLFKQLSKNNR